MGYEDKNEPEKNKESIEEILSDLNGLLNKMPTILSDIKMPDITKRDFKYAALTDNQSQNDEIQPSVDIKSMSDNSGENTRHEAGLEINSKPEDEIADLKFKKSDLSVDKKTVKEDDDNLENLDFMVSSEDLSNFSQKDAQITIEPSEPIEPPAEKNNFLDKTRDFGVPDIDALLDLSSNGVDEPMSESEGKKLDNREELSNDIVTADNAEVKIENDANLSGGAMNLNDNDERNFESKDNDMNTNAPEASLESVDTNDQAPADEGIKIDESEENIKPVTVENVDEEVQDDEKTIIASPEDFQTMLKESANTDDSVASETAAEDSNNKISDEQPDPDLFKEAVQPEEQSESVQPEIETASDISQIGGIQGIEEPRQEAVQPEEQSESVQPEVETVSDISQIEGIQGIEEPRQEAVQPEEQSESVQPEIEPVLNISQIEGIQGIEDEAGNTLQSEPVVDNSSSELELESANQEAEDKTLVLESANSVFSNEVSEQPQGLNDGGEADIQPLNDVESSPSQDAPDAAEETIMATPGDNPSITNRRKFTGNIKDLVEKQIPEGIPFERIKPMVFLYAMTDESLCADIINDMDFICLKSQEKPMFVKRPAVEVCDPEIKGEYALQIVAENEALGIICVGDIPQDSVYEIQNALNTKGIFFKYINRENFSHALIVDIVADLILL